MIRRALKSVSRLKGIRFFQHSVLKDWEDGFSQDLTASVDSELQGRTELIASIKKRLPQIERFMERRKSLNIATVLLTGLLDERMLCRAIGTSRHQHFKKILDEAEQLLGLIDKSPAWLDTFEGSQKSDTEIVEAMTRELKRLEDSLCSTRCALHELKKEYEVQGIPCLVDQNLLNQQLNNDDSPQKQELRV